LKIYDWLGGGLLPLDIHLSLMQNGSMKCFKSLTICMSLLLTACLNNPTIDEEIAGKCAISVAEYQRYEAVLDKSHEGMSLRAGRCRLTRTSKDAIEGTVVD